MDGGVRRWVNGCRNAVLPCWDSLLLLGIREAEARHSLARKGVIKLVYSSGGKDHIFFTGIPYS